MLATLMPAMATHAIFVRVSLSVRMHTCGRQNTTHTTRASCSVSGQTKASLGPYPVAGVPQNITIRMAVMGVGT